MDCPTHNVPLPCPWQANHDWQGQVPVDDGRVSCDWMGATGVCPLLFDPTDPPAEHGRLYDITAHQPVPHS